MGEDRKRLRHGHLVVALPASRQRRVPAVWLNADRRPRTTCGGSSFKFCDTFFMVCVSSLMQGSI